MEGPSERRGGPNGRDHGSWRVSMRPLVVILLFVCAATASSSFGPSQAPPPSSETFLKRAQRALAHGRFSEAEGLARAQPAGDSDASAILARVVLRRGQFDEARTLLEPAAAASPAGEAALELGLLHQLLGRAEAATPLLMRVFQQSASANKESLLRAGRAAQALGRPYDANALFRAAASGGLDPAVETAWGRLFLEKHDPAEALRSFKQAVQADPKWAPAHAGIAATLAQEDPAAAASAAARALEIDPDLAEAHLLLADLELDNTRYDEARKHIDRVLETNPAHLEARALIGAIAYVRDDRTAFDTAIKGILGTNPAYGEAYRVAADLSARNYRFDEAVRLTQEALSLDPGNSQAYADLGMHLMRTGDEGGARRALERAFKMDGFNRVTLNLLTLLDTLDKFEVIREGDLILKLHPTEAAVLREYAVPLAQESLKVLSAKYQFTPKGPILVEIFPRHDDFAVRNLGIPGLVGALGACFGRVISMDSPKARTPGSFSWQATLWHEMAHVITLQMSNQRVPRWLTEGISVYEETRARPAWGRDMEVPFAMALEQGRVLKLADLNSGFTSAETIALAYYQASLLVEHIVATHGDAPLRTLIRTYGDGLEGEEAITKALGVSIDALQASFDKMLDARFSSVRAALRAQVKAGETTDIASLRQLASEHPNSYQAQLLLGTALAAQGDKAAYDPLERAAALVPMAIGESSPYAVMGRLAEQLGDSARAIKAYQALLAQDHTAIEPARRLATLASKAGDDRALAVANERIVEIDPFDAQGHTGVGRLAIKRGDAPTAVRAFRAALAIGPADRAAAHCDLGESYLLAGRRDDAKREALAALEIAPSFERAQELLLKVVDGKGGGRNPGGRRP
jgi:tetratricopeptide (TPR) repeat protein